MGNNYFIFAASKVFMREFPGFAEENQAQFATICRERFSLSANSELGERAGVRWLVD
jgi:hypothetical protein